MVSGGYSFDENAARRIVGAVRAVENSQIKTGVPVRPGRGPAPSREAVYVQITSTTQTSGYYPGKLFFYDGTADNFIDPSIVVWVKELNGGTLATSTYYEALPAAPFTGGGATHLACVVDLGGGTTDQVLKVNGTSSTATGLYDATIYTPPANSITLTAGANVWLFLPPAPSLTLTAGDYYIGFKNGTFTAVPSGGGGAVSRDLYIGMGGWVASVSCSGSNAVGNTY